MENKAETFEAALVRFIETVQNFRKAKYGEGNPANVEPGGVFELDWQLRTMPGKRFVKMVTPSRYEGKEINGSVFCFIEIATGLVYKAASFKAPAKHARGSIYSQDFNGYGVSAYGGRYL
jgi:hypothetical protein